MSNLNLVELAKQLAYQSHRGTNHTYDRKDYVDTHVALVVKYVKKYINFLPDQTDWYLEWGFYWKEIVEAAAWLHDTIEDCRLTPNDIMRFFINAGIPERVAFKIAQLVFAVSNEKGWTRSDRANDKYYIEMRKVHGAVYIKLCDRFANIEYSATSGSGMSGTYTKEYKHFREMLYRFKDSLHWMWHDLDRLVMNEFNIIEGTIVSCANQPAVVLGITTRFGYISKVAEAIFEVWLMNDNVNADAGVEAISIYEPT